MLAFRTMDRVEHRLLLACAAVGDNKALIDTILAGPIDREYLISQAGQHGLTSLLYRCAEGAFPELHGRYLESARRNLRFTGELFKVLDFLQKHGIRAIPFKGPVLAYALYEDPALREFGDLDLLVLREDAFAAAKLLPAIGYAATPAYPEAVRSRILKWKNHISTNKPNGMLLELHWTVLPRYFVLDLGEPHWHERTVTVTVDGRPVPNLAPEDQLVALSAHGCKHLWSSLAWVADIAHLIERNPGLDWEAVTVRCGAPDLRRMVSIALILAHDLLGANPPPEILRRARSDRATAALTRSLAAGMFERRGGRETLPYVSFHLRAKSRMVDRLLFCWRIVRTPVFLGKAAPPRFLAPIHALLRPTRSHSDDRR